MEKKAIKPGVYFTLMPILSIVVTMIVILVMLVVLRSQAVETDMLSVVPIILVGLGLMGIMLLIEKIGTKKHEISWIKKMIAIYLIPIAIWGISTLLALTNWWDNRESEDALVLKWFTMTFLIYAAVAFLFRCVLHIISVIIDKKAEKR